MRDYSIAEALRIPVATKIVIAVTAVTVFLIGVRFPYHNWDIIGYVAAAYRLDGFRGEALRDKTYADVSSEVGAFMLGHLTAGPYRQAVSEEPRALEQQLPFYLVKIGYVQLVRAAGRVGLSYAQGTVWISALFSALSVVVLGILSHRMQLPALVVPLLAAFGGHLQVARGSLPDALACFFSLLAVLLALNRSGVVYVFSAILPLMRPDYLILSALLMGYQFLRGERLHALISMTASVIAYVAVDTQLGGYGWLTLFNFTLISGASPYPAEMVISRHLSHYLLPYARVWRDVVNGQFFVLFCLAAFVIAREFRSRKSSREFWMLFAIPFSFVALHLCLFPLYEDRFFGFAASLLLVGLFALIREWSEVGQSTEPRR